jgi:ClpP class serine protease
VGWQELRDHLFNLILHCPTVAQKAVVPVYAMSGGTLIALAADEIVLGEFSVLGPIDPQIFGLPAASIVKARDSKPVESVFDLTLVLADVSEKAVSQVKSGAVELLKPRMDQAAAEALADKLTSGRWTHDYDLTASEARALGLPVRVDMPMEVMQLMTLYPQPIQQSVEQRQVLSPLVVVGERVEEHGEDEAGLSAGGLARGDATHEEVGERRHVASPSSLSITNLGGPSRRRACSSLMLTTA